MSRPKQYTEPRIATAIRLPESLRDELLGVARERDVSVNYLVTRAVSDYLRRLPPLGAAHPSPAGGRRGRAEGRPES